MDIKENIPLAPYTTLKIGGSAEYFVEVYDITELHDAVSFAHEKSLPISVIAGGSNVLVSDEGVNGLVIKVALEGVSLEEDINSSVVVSAGAGEDFDAFIARAVQSGWWGIENLSAIPGSVGATPVQNVGAYGLEVRDVIEWVEVFDTKANDTKRLTVSECSFGYRDSIFKHEEGKKYIVTRVAYRLKKDGEPQITYRDLAEWFAGAGDTPTLAEVRAAVMRIRSRKFPDWNTTGTAGSFFKNPVISHEEYESLKETYADMPGYKLEDGSVKVPLGWIFDKILDARGVTEGNVGTYEGQALVVINHGSATQKEVDAFANKLAQNVFDATKITIEREVTSM